MTNRGLGQGWILDTFIGVGGWEVLHPGARPTLEAFGYDHGDIDRVFSRIGTGSMIPKAFTEVGASVKAKAEFYEQKGFPLLAHSLYARATLLWGRAQYSYFRDDARKFAFRDTAHECADKMIALSPTRIQRVEIPFEGRTLFALLHLPAQPLKNAPAVILVPGMDMVKEEWTYFAQRYCVSRGVAALAVDGPGQGESLSHGLKVTVTNYESAISTYIDYLANRVEVDPERIGLWGLSMGSYWGMRSAAKEHRLRAVGSAMGCYGDMDTIFNRAQPKFKSNFMYMAGYDDEAEFDSLFASQMNLWDLAPQIECPVFMGFGEFDELTTLEQTLALYEAIHAPKEICVWEQEFHSLGGVVTEMLPLAILWLERALNGEFDTPGRDERRYFSRDGFVHEGSANPPWWLGAEPDEIKPNVTGISD